jgi:hypothetical protein
VPVFPVRRGVTAACARVAEERHATMDNYKRRKSDSDVTGDLCRRFGAIAVCNGFVTLDEMKAAIMDQIDDDVSGREHRLLGSILFSRGLITERQIEIVLQELKETLE